METSYRITRPRLYGPGTAGFTDATARQGYYVRAVSPNNARDVARRVYGFTSEEPLTVEVNS